ncbi:MAG: hypothetical protein ACTIKK_09895 [Agrococcus casei]|uniref:hypothetical protein n=1 Tax=Agrococcus casei TaxID=343512 RepID=UPI003F928FD0
MRTRALLPLALFAAAALGLTGCQAGLLAPTPSETEVAPSGAAPVESPSEEASEESPEESPSEGEPDEAPSQEPLSPGEAVDFTCESLFTLQQLYEYDPNFTPSNEAPAELPAAFSAIADAGGLVCAFQHVTAGALLLVGIAPEDADLGEASGYTNNGVIGTETAEAGEYVIAVGSDRFGKEGDAAGLLQQVSGNVTAE